MKEYRFNWDGDNYRVLVCEDVLAIPGWAGQPGWSMGGFGCSISVEWLLGEGKLPGSKRKQKAQAQMLVAALDAYHGHAPDAEFSVTVADDPKGPFMPCATCHGNGSIMPGWVPATADYKGPRLVRG